jgi:hypothetical protein
MLTCRLDNTEADRVRAEADARGVSVSHMIREALRRYLNDIAAERDAATYERSPLTPEELSALSIQSWPPAEDWSDWADASG